MHSLLPVNVYHPRAVQHQTGSSVALCFYTGNAFNQRNKNVDLIFTSEALIFCLSWSWEYLAFWLKAALNPKVNHSFIILQPTNSYHFFGGCFYYHQVIQTVSLFIKRTNSPEDLAATQMRKNIYH